MLKQILMAGLLAILLASCGMPEDNRFSSELMPGLQSEFLETEGPWGGGSASGYIEIQPADFSSNCKVDAADYVIWRKHYEAGVTSGATQYEGDADGDGAVTNADYAIWRASFGNTCD